MTEYVGAHIPVLDAPPIHRQRSGFWQSWPGGAKTLLLQLFFALLIAFAMFCFSRAFHATTGKLNLLMVYLRYLLWPTILLGLAIHLFRRGGAHYARTVPILLPFLTIGIVSGALGFDPVDSTRMIIFWVLAVTAGIVIGAELPARTIRSVILWTLFGLLVLSILLVIAKPGFAIMRDARTGDAGAWRGLFPGKNALGQMSAFAIVLAVAATDMAWKWRSLIILAAIVCLIFAASQGSVLLAAAGIGFLFAIGFLKKTGLTSGVQASILLFLSVFITVLAYAAYAPVLELLGRDPSLTGRTDIWANYFDRALDHWIIGAGPDSFMSLSSVTGDIGRKFGVDTPHNMYLAAFGETGIFGLFAYATAWIYFAFVVPFRFSGLMAMQTAAVAFLMIFGGLGETHEVFGPAFGMFLTMCLYSGMLSSREAEPKAVVGRRASVDDIYQPSIPRLA